MTDKQFYRTAYKFLLSFEGVTELEIKRHLKSEYRKPKNLDLIYLRLCASAQNRQMSNRVVGEAFGGVENLTIVLAGFNPHKVARLYRKGDGARLFSVVRKKLKPSGALRATSRSIWPQYCETIIQGAHFLSQYKDGREFLKWVLKFTEDNRSVAALPQLICTEIDGFGFPLACDFLKEIGCVEYGKPDVHIKETLKGVGFLDSLRKNAKSQDYEAFKVLDRVARSNNVSTFEVDKILWLIGSGNFYRSDLKIGRQRDRFISYCNSKWKL